MSDLPALLCTIPRSWSDEKLREWRPKMSRTFPHTQVKSAGFWIF